MKHSLKPLFFVLVLTGLILSACKPTSVPSEVEKPVVVEPIEGSDFSQVTLTDKAMERLGLEFGSVHSDVITRTQTLAATVMRAQVLPKTGTLTDASVDSEASAETRTFVYLSLIPSELEQINLQEAVTVFMPGQNPSSGIKVSQMSMDEVAALDFQPVRAGTFLAFSLDKVAQAYTPGQRVMVEVNLTGNGSERLVIPFASVIYGLQGQTWVYTNPKTAVFVREAVTIDYVDGDLAYLTDGPENGTSIVTVGAAMLYGAESGIGGGGGGH